MKRAIFCTCLLIVPMLTLGVGEISPFRALTSDGGGCDLRVVKRVSEREREMRRLRAYGFLKRVELICSHNPPVTSICNASWWGCQRISKGGHGSCMAFSVHPCPLLGHPRT